MFCCRTQHHQEGMRQEAKRYVPLPAVPLAYLVLLEADFALGRLETIFYGPASARDPDRLVGERSGRPVGQVVGVLLLRLVDAAPQKQPATRFRPVRIGQRHAGPVVRPFSLAPLTGG